MCDVMTRIVDLTPGMQSLNITCIVLDIGPPTITKGKQEVRCFKVADETGSVNMSVWDNAGRILVPGDILRMTSGYASVWRQCLTLYIGKKGCLWKIGEYTRTPMSYTATPNMSKTNPAFDVDFMTRNFGGKRRNWTRRHHNVVAVAPAPSARSGVSLFPPAPIRPLRQDDSSAFARPSRSIDPSVPIRQHRPLPAPAHRRLQLIVMPISRSKAIAAASAVVAPAAAVRRPATSQAPPAVAAPAVPVMLVAPIVRHVAPARLESPPGPLVDYYRPPRHGRGH